MKQLIVNADDFGLTAGVSDAILEAADAGSVTSTTMLVNGTAAMAAAQAASRRPALGVGLHFNLTLGLPTADAKSIPALLGADGAFGTRRALAMRSVSGRLDPAQVGRELQAQWDRLRALGVVPTHVDGHQHVHLIPRVFSVVAEFCVAQRVPLRMPWPLAIADARVPWSRRAKYAATGALLRRQQRRWHGRLATNAGFGSVFDLGDVADGYADSHYRRVLGAAGAWPFELMVHASRDAADVDGLTRIGRVSTAEFRFLRGDGFARVARDLGLTLVNYRALHATE